MAVHPGSLWIDRNWATLVPGLWVAATAARLVAENRDYDRLIAAVTQRGINLADIAIVLVPVDIVQ